MYKASQERNKIALKDKAVTPPPKSDKVIPTQPPPTKVWEVERSENGSKSSKR